MEGWKTGNGRDDAKDVIEAGDAAESGGHDDDMLVGDDGHEVSDLGMFNCAGNKILYPDLGGECWKRKNIFKNF